MRSLPVSASTDRRSSRFAGILLVGVAGVASAIVLIGCGSPEKPGKYPTRPEGCDVQVFPESPTMPTDNIGPVNAICGDDIGNDACLRTLKDEACKLGGDVVWGVADVPSLSLGKKRLNGRAAHTKMAGAAPGPAK